MIATCEVCKKEKPDEEPFEVPWDHVGMGIMIQHFLDVHKINVRDKKEEVFDHSFE